MTPAQRIGRLVRSRNQQLQKDARVEYGIGAAFSVLVFGGFFILAYMMGLIAGDSPFLFALGLTVAMVALFTLVAWRTVNPTRELLPLDKPKAVARLVSGATPSALDFVPRTESPGTISFFLSGPESLLKAWGMQRNLLPVDDALFARAFDVLQRCERGIRLNRIAEITAEVVLLRRLGLIRVERRDSGQTLVLTDSGRALLDQV